MLSAKKWPKLASVVPLALLYVLMVVSAFIELKKIKPTFPTQIITFNCAKQGEKQQGI
jgi:hypothetical protein